MKDVVFFSVNNWFSGRDYPNTPNFRKWLGNDLKQNFQNDRWCKKNKLCVYCGVIDMSFNYTVSASRKWVEKNCPELLTDEEYTYRTVIGKPKKTLFGNKLESVEIEHKKKYSDFVFIPEEGELTPDGDHFGMPFREYCKENFGLEYYETGYWEDEIEYMMFYIIMYIAFGGLFESLYAGINSFPEPTRMTEQQKDKFFLIFLFWPIYIVYVIIKRGYKSIKYLLNEIQGKNDRANS